MRASTSNTQLLLEPKNPNRRKGGKESFGKWGPSSERTAQSNLKEVTMLDRIQAIYDAITALGHMTEAFLLILWASVSVIGLLLFGGFILYKTVVWVITKPSGTLIGKEAVRILVAGVIVLLVIGLPLGLIAVIPGAGQFVADLVGAIFGPAPTPPPPV